MSDLYHVMYAGTQGFDPVLMQESMLTNLKQKTNFVASKIENTHIITVDHPNDMETIINTLDDKMIAVAYSWVFSAGVYTIATFILTGDNRKDSDILTVIKQIDSSKGN